MTSRRQWTPAQLGRERREAWDAGIARAVRDRLNAKADMDLAELERRIGNLTFGEYRRWRAVEGWLRLWGIG